MALAAAMVLTASLASAALNGAVGALPIPLPRLVLRAGAFFTHASGFAASPGTISFPLSNPNQGQVAGSSSATVIWHLIDGDKGVHTWNVKVRAETANFANCPATIPASAIRVTCTSATGTNGATGNCSGQTSLTTDFVTVANGYEGSAGADYTVTLTLTADESWRYKGSNSSCTLSLQYQLDSM